MRTEEYLSILADQIRCKRARTGITQEIRSHLEDQQAAYEREGMEAGQAELLAVREMGSPVEAGVELDRIHRPRMAWGIILLICCISIAGFAVQQILEIKFADADFLPYSGRRYLLHMITGLLLMTGICFYDYSRIRSRAKEITVILFAVLVLEVFLFGVAYNGQRAWIRLGAVSLDVRRILFLFVPLYGAILYDYRGQGYQALLKGVVWTLPAISVALWCPSMTTAVMLGGSFLITLSAAVLKGWFRIAKVRTLTALWSVVILFPVISGFLMLRTGKAFYTKRLNAVFGFTDQAEAYLVRTTRELLGGSMWIGFGKVPIEQMLPGSNDYVLTHFIVYFGILAAVLLIGLIMLLMFCLFRISLKQNNQLAMLMGVGSTAAIVVQILLYVLTNTGVISVSAYCPFLNYGGSGMMTTYVLLGLLLSICRYERVITGDSMSEDRKRAWRIRLVIEKEEGTIRTKQYGNPLTWPAGCVILPSNNIPINALIRNSICDPDYREKMVGANLYDGSMEGSSQQWPKRCDHPVGVNGIPPLSQEPVLWQSAVCTVEIRISLGLPEFRWNREQLCSP